MKIPRKQDEKQLSRNRYDTRAGTKNTYISETARPSIIPAWLVQLEDAYQLDVGSFPDLISLKCSLNHARLQQLSFELGRQGYTYEVQLRAFCRAGDGNEIC